MEKRDNKTSLIIGLSVLVTVICFGLCVYFSLWAFLGELVAQGLIMIVSWVPCVGLAILELVVYIYGLYCRRTNIKEAKKMDKATWVLGIIVNSYMIIISLLFVCTDFANLSRYLAVSIPSVLNFILLILWARKYNKKNEG